MTEPGPDTVKVQVRTLLPPLEQAPDHTVDRPSDAVRLTLVPMGNDADPVLPVATLMPAGLEVTRSPLRPVAVRVIVAVCGEERPWSRSGPRCRSRRRTLP